MIIKIFKREVVSKNGKKQIRKLCIIRCEECGVEKESRLDSVQRCRLNRGAKIDLCLSCSLLLKYAGPRPRGKDNKNFKHGLHNSGYRLLTVDDGRKCFEHQYIMEQELGRRLDKKERVHHIDFDKINNKIFNLYLCNSVGSHSLCHKQMEKIGYALFGKRIWFDRSSKKYVLTKIFLKNNYIKKKSEKNILKVNKLYKIYYKRTNSYYYKYAFKDCEGKWIIKSYHVALMEQKIGRRLFINECVHHIDGDTLNNNIFNLFLVTRSEHTIAHISLQHCVAELYKRGIVGFDKKIGKYFVVEKLKKNSA